MLMPEADLAFNVHSPQVFILTRLQVGKVQLGATGKHQLVSGAPNGNQGEETPGEQYGDKADTTQHTCSSK